MPGLNHAPTPTPAPAEFNALLHEALLTRKRNTPDHALRSGVDVYGVIRYVAGVLDPAAHAEVQAQLVCSPWAQGRVVALVKLTRNDAPLSHQEGTAHLLLQCARDDDWSRFIPDGLDDPEAHLADVLDCVRV